MRFLKIYKEFAQPSLTALLLFSIPLGFLFGLAEIFFGVALLYFISSYGVYTQLPSEKLSLLESFSPIFVFFLAVTFRTIFAYLNSLTSQLNMERLSWSIRKYIGRQLPKSGFEQAQISVAEINNVLSVLMPKCAAFAAQFAQFVSSALTIVVTIVGMTGISFKLTAIALAALVVLGLPTLVFRKIFQKLSTQTYEYMNFYNRRLIKDLRNFEYLRIVSRLGYEGRNLEKISDRLNSVFNKYAIAISGNANWPQVAAAVIMAVVVISNHKGSLVEGAFLVPFVYLLIRLATSLSAAVYCLGNIQFNYPYVQDLFKLVEKISFPVSAERTRTKVLDSVSKIEFLNLAIGRNGIAFVKGLNLKALPGDFVLISGESGRGKSSLLLTALGLLEPISGKVIWNQVEACDLDFQKMIGKLAYSGPDPFLLDLSIRENLLYGNESLNLGEEQLWQALDLACCDFVRDIGLNFSLKEGGDGISAGQKQRISLARAFLVKPVVLILDEATANIDIETEATIMENIKRDMANTIVFAVSHRQSLKKFANKFIEL